MRSKLLQKTACYHCGDDCPTCEIVWEDKVFCCHGCLSVHRIIVEGGLKDYYTYASHPGIKGDKNQSDFTYLDNEAILTSLVTFREGHLVRLNLQIPAIHCSSCVWLLENLDRLHDGVRQVRVDFLLRKASVLIDTNEISVRELAELLSRIGYEPRITLDQEERKEMSRKGERQLLLRLAVAGFCFGNVMLFSFPEYFGLSVVHEGGFVRLFAGLNLLLSVPALLYSGWDYIRSAWKSVRSRNLHINVPLALGMVALFGRTVYEIVSGYGPGYADSLTGLIFFLLVGKWFQQKTYDALSFERDYRSYFPLAVTCIVDGGTTTKPLSSVQEGDRLLIRNGELVPVDGILLSGKGQIDYSFVTGESVPVTKNLGEILYAGGRQTGERLEIEALKRVEQSHLTRLWNNNEKERNTGLSYFADRIGKIFTWALLGIAGITFAVWAFIDLSMAFFTVTSVLIVACPCALALSSPFALGNAMRILGRAGLYLRNSQVVEDMAGVDSVVFDKTGTLTQNGEFTIEYEGDELSNHHLEFVRGLVSNSTHPYSKGLYAHLAANSTPRLDAVREFPGKGLYGKLGSEELQIGSTSYVEHDATNRSGVHVRFKNGPAGTFIMRNAYRPYIKDLTEKLDAARYGMSLLSGDNVSENERITRAFPAISGLHFNMDPVDKQHVIRDLKTTSQVLMIGDGLNDAGALREANVGIVLTEDTNNFTPAAKGILMERSFLKLPAMLRFSKRTMQVIRLSLVFSLVYNTAGLFFAVQGLLSPVIAAILMPASSITVVALNTFLTTFLGRKEGLI